MQTVRRAIWGCGRRGEGRNRRKISRYPSPVQMVFMWFDKDASKDHHDVTGTYKILSGDVMSVLVF